MPSAAIIVPTQDRAAYLDVALASLAPQARAAGAELIVVDDGPGAATREVAERHGARYVAHDRPRGLNAARNSGIDATGAELLAFVDDDIEADGDWLATLLRGAGELPDEVGVLTGPIRWRVEGRRFRACGREGGPITWQDFGPADTDCPHAWGSNMALRRSAIEAVGRFDEALGGGGPAGSGDEVEWQRRWREHGGRIRYLAGAAVDHRRSGEDARLRSLCRAARGRGRASRWADERGGRAPGLGRELRTLAGCLLHGPRRLCAMGPVMSWHTLGRIEAALRTPPPRAGGEDFLSGAGGNVEGARALIARGRDALADARLARTTRRLRRSSRRDERARVLVLAVERRNVTSLLTAAVSELRRSRHEIELAVGEPGDRGKFENLNRLLEGRDLSRFDWLLVLDDDVTLPRAFLDEFLHACEQYGLRIAQPAHRHHSHAAWAVTRRQAGVTARTTNFVEIGPVTAFHRETFATLLPFPGLRMGWGLDAHWAALAREHGWPIGIVDATPIGHVLRPAATTYPREQAVDEARRFLAGRPYVRRDEVRTLEEHR